MIDMSIANEQQTNASCASLDCAPSDALSSTSPSREPHADVRYEDKNLIRDASVHVTKISDELYEAELYRLQGELVKMQKWVKTTGARVVIIFEGRDAAGKGGTIKRITEYLSPRVARVVALPTPTERESTQWYFQRYIQHLPAAGEIVLFDRSWYNRAGVEKVMGFASAAQVQQFMRQCPIFEQMLVDDGILLRKYWFSVSDDVQYKRFQSRLDDPLRQWKLSPMDLESITRWEDYSRAKDEMMVHTDTPFAPWFHVLSDSKKQARLNMISHLLDSLPWYEVDDPHGAHIVLPERPAPSGYVRPAVGVSRYVPDHTADVIREAAEAKGRTGARTGTKSAEGSAKANKAAHKKSNGKGDKKGNKKGKGKGNDKKPHPAKEAKSRNKDTED